MTEKTKILFIDDEEINLQLFEINFENKYNVLTANSGIKGFEILKMHTDVSVVLCDLKMPNMSGEEFIKLARVNYPDLIFFILTGYELTSVINESLKTGEVQKYFRKPFNFREIERAIDDVSNVGKYA